MGEVIDIAAWRHARTRGAPLPADPPREGKALGRVLGAHAAWAGEPEARWLWSLLSQVADAAPGDLAFTLDGLPVPPAVSAWLGRGEQALALPARALVRLWLAEVHHWRWRDREPAARAWVRGCAAAEAARAGSEPPGEPEGCAGSGSAAPALPAALAAWLDVAAERDGTTRDALIASMIASMAESMAASRAESMAAGPTASGRSPAPTDGPRPVRQRRS